MRLLLAERNMMIKDLAKKSGVSRQTISYILSGKGCSMQVIYKIATTLETEVDHIVLKEGFDE
ncbi:MAG: helix-turn-helix transcriptional regulator [Eubacteriales bacterium]|nr:helix-turn-helix transcriptional regulator [Eubacteriales bacterium]